MMTLCTTRSGPYQCMHTVNEKGEHPGACEAQAREYAKRTEFVTRNGFWWDLCAAKLHGLSKHVNGVCTACPT